MTEGSNMIMPVAPTGGFGNGGFGGWGSDVWIILLVLFAFGGFGGWGGMGGFGGGYMGGYDFPWLLASNANNQNSTQSSFDNLATQNSIAALQGAVTSGFGDTQLGIAGINQNICSSTGQIVQAVNSGFAQSEIAANARQMADMQQNFAMQTSMGQGFNGVTAQVAQAGFDSRYAIAGLGSDLAREACANRTVSTQNAQTIINALNEGVQSIKDQMYSDKMDSKNEKILELQNALNMATLRESQVAQNAFIQQGFTDEVDQLYNRLSNCPVPSTPVYGRTPIFTCSGNGGCGCGNNGFYN